MATDPKDRTIEALREVWASISALGAGLSEAEWTTPSPLAGWTVQDNLAHMTGTEMMLLGEPNPEVTVDRDLLGHVRNDIGEFNEVWVEHLRSRPGVEVLAMFDDATARRLAARDAMSDDEWNAESFTPAGRDTYGRFMQIRVFDCWLHEQDMRDAVGRPGHESGVAVEVTLDEMTGAMGFVVGKRAGAADGQSVRFDLTDAGSVVRSIGVAVDGRAAVVGADHPRLASPTVVLTMPVGVMTRLCAGRTPLTELRASVELAGDAEVGERVLANLNYTI